MRHSRQKNMKLKSKASETSFLGILGPFPQKLWKKEFSP